VLGVLRVQIAGGANQCDVMRKNGQARLRIMCLPGLHQRPGDLGNSLGLGNITFSHVRAYVITQAEASLYLTLPMLHAQWY